MPQKLYYVRSTNGPIMTSGSKPVFTNVIALALNEDDNDKNARYKMSTRYFCCAALWRKMLSDFVAAIGLFRRNIIWKGHVALVANEIDTRYGH